MGGGASKRVSNHVDTDQNSTPEALQAAREIHEETRKELDKVKQELARVHADVENERKSKAEAVADKERLVEVQKELEVQLEALGMTNMELQAEISLMEDEDGLQWSSSQHQSLSLARSGSINNSFGMKNLSGSLENDRSLLSHYPAGSRAIRSTSSGFTKTLGRRVSRSSIAVRQDASNRTPAAVAKMLRKYQERSRTSKEDDERDRSVGKTLHNMVFLPRGGVYVSTSHGAIQFGVAPETIKDSVNLGLNVSTRFVVPRERFNLHAGINVSEIEFPAFYNFFVLGRKVTLITEKHCAKDLLTIMKEALNGPDLKDLYAEEEYSKFCSDETFAARPDHVKEVGSFREPRPPKFEPIEVESLIELVFFDENGECQLEDGLMIRDIGYGYTVLDGGNLVAVVSDEQAKSCYLPANHSSVTTRALEEENKSSINETTPSVLETQASLNLTSSSDASEEHNVMQNIHTQQNLRQKPFVIPRFGITILGNSHGFDANGFTSGFVVWVNGQGVMVDPPPHSGQILMESGIQPKSITATILTHCHADHDAGTIQKMITEDKVTLMTTKTVFRSLLRKYAGVSGLAVEFLAELVNFRPVFVEEPTYWNGANFRFFYSMHSIPCVGFEVSFEGKSMIYSADTYYDPQGLEDLCTKGVLSEARKNALLNFNWNCDMVLHESGVPPTHTPLSAFKHLPQKVLDNLHLIHIGAKDAIVAENEGFRVCKVGVENTVVLCPPHDKNDTLAYLQLIASVDLFKGFAINQALELLLMSHRTKYKVGDVIAQEGTPGDKFIIIMQGEASVSFGNVVKVFKAGDYLGEISVVTGAKRTATITSHTDSIIVEVDKYAFSYFLFKDRQLARRMNNLVKARLDGSWQAISSNSVLRSLSTNQKTSLQAMLTMKKYKKGETIYKCGEQAKDAVLISQGELIFAEIHNVNPKDLLTATRHARMKNISMQEEAMLNIHDTSDCAIKYDNMSVGAFICDTFAMNGSSPLTMTLVCASKDVTLFLLPKDAVLTFLDNSPMLLLALLKTIVLM